MLLMHSRFGGGHAMSEQKLDPETVETIFDLVKNAPERQMDNANTLDTKIVQVFSAASVVIGLLGISSGNLEQARWISACLVGALSLYGVTAISTFLHLWPKPFRRSLHGDTLWQEAWNMTRIEVHHTVIADVSKAYVHNKSLLRGKAYSLSIAVFATAVEVVLVGLALLLSRLG